MAGKRAKIFDSIQTTLTLAVVLIIVSILITVVVLVYTTTDKVLEDNAVTTNKSLVTQISYDIEFYLRNTEVAIESLMLSDGVKDFFAGSDKGLEMMAVASMNSLIDSREDVINVVLIRSDGEILANDQEAEVKEDMDFTKQPYYEKAITSDEMVVSESLVQNIFYGHYLWVVSCSRAYVNPESGQIEGVILVDLNYKMIQDMVSRSSIGDKGYVFIVDNLGSIVYHPKQPLIYNNLQEEKIQDVIDSDQAVISATVNGQKVHYLSEDSIYSQWYVIGKVYDDEINVYSETLRNYSFWMLILALIIGTMLAFVVSGSILKPVDKLVGGIYQFQSGNLDVEVHVDSHNELGLLTMNFNRMTKRIKALVKQNQEAERTKRKSEIEALQSQINPHFLYNTLDSIVWMAESGKSEEVVLMTSSLAKLFRISINKGEEVVTLKQEIEHVESYLVIQQMRYGDKLQYEIDVDPSIYPVRMIKLILQPLVENAIYHGIKQVPGQGMIWIRGKKEEDSIVLEVEDNGMGMEKAVIDELMAGHNVSTKKDGGVGAFNVDQRIKLYYGMEYGISIESELYEGTTISIRLPLMEEVGHEKE